MNSRSKKYHESRKASRDGNKGAATKTGYAKQNEKTIKEPSENPAPSRKQDNPSADATPAEQDDTRGQ
jgi:hypothetical protein